MASSPTAAPRRSEELFELRLRYGVGYRTGAQRDQGPGLSYDGLSPVDPSVQGWVFPLFGGLLGVHAGFGFESFALRDRDTNVRITGGTLFRGHGAATARFRLGPVRLEPIVGYSLTQVPDFGNSAAPVMRGANRHGLLLAARGLLDLGPITIEGRFDYNVGLAANDASGQRATSNGLWAGGGVRWAFLRTGTLLWGLMADAAYSSDRLVGNIDTTQTHVRGGLSLDLQWKEPDRPPMASFRVTVVAADTNKPATTAKVLIRTSTGEQAPALDETGSALLSELEPEATVSVRASLDGYDDAEGSLKLAAGLESPLVLTLKKQPPKLGTVLVTVVDKTTRAALAGATATLNGKAATTDAKGVARFVDLQPGPVSITFSAPGFTEKAEATTVLPGLEATVSTELVSAKKRDPATVSGFVRSARGGAPVTANLSIPEASIKAKADDKGAFAFRLNGGTYTVTISAKGFVTQTKQVSVKDGDQAILNVDLQPK